MIFLGDIAHPLCPDPVNSGVLIARTDAAAVDTVACKLMGSDPSRIPIVWKAFASHRWPISLESLETLMFQDGRLGNVIPLREVASAVPGGFVPHFGWKSHIEESAS